MNKYKIESHTHTHFSHDGQMSLGELISEAKKKGLIYLATTEHLDREYIYVFGNKVRQLDLVEYDKGFNEAKKNVGGMYIAYGLEVGYYNHKDVLNFYETELLKYNYDVIINSVHCVAGQDLYYFQSDNEDDKLQAYTIYLNAVLESVKVNYHYDIIGHLGYITRYVPYKEKSLLMPETKGLIDEILKEIIKRGKTIELNSSNKAGGILPEKAILERYFLLGGRHITFGSDAHYAHKLGDRYEQAASLAISCGFTHWTIYKNHQKEYVLI